jgi:hypothetical protein
MDVGWSIVVVRNRGYRRQAPGSDDASNETVRQNPSSKHLIAVNN